VKRAFAIVVMLLFVGVSFSSAQDAASSFLERARTATAKYQDQSVAILEGYRRIGRDFPAMGEHWIRLAFLFAGKIDAEHPEVLTYVPVDGGSKLTGVAYALPLLPGESPPDLPAPKDAWHDHFRTIEDETVLPLHHVHAGASSMPRIAMLHAWIWTRNPDGVFAADNWAIPYVRAGLMPRENEPRSAAAALSLLNGGVEYFTATVDAVASPSAKQRVAINAAFARARSIVERDVRENRIAGLSDIWTQLLQSVESAIEPKLRPDLRVALP
jgi:hypothetical protein